MSERWEKMAEAVDEVLHGAPLEYRQRLAAHIKVCSGCRKALKVILECQLHALEIGGV